MKKTYIDPKLQIISINVRYTLLTASDPTDPTQIKTVEGSFSGSSALGKSGGFWSDEEVEEDN